MRSTHSQSAAAASGAASSSNSGRYSKIADKYQTLEQVQKALREAGLESSNLILGIDFTKSNEWTGEHSFEGRSLHATEHVLNPYEQGIKIIGETLSEIDDDNLIPCYGFGDGPTSFAPIINAAVKTVEDSGGQYHVLLIIADGQVTRSVDTEPGDLSIQEQATIDAIVAASYYPLSIVLVGVGDGPWDMMRQFDDNIPARAFDNFKFVKFTDIMRPNLSDEEREALFALERREQEQGARRPLPPPHAVDRSRSQGGNHESENRFANRGEVERFPSHRSPGSQGGKYMQTISRDAPQAFGPQHHRHGERSTENNSSNQQVSEMT